MLYDDIKLGVSGLTRLVGNMHAGLIKRDPKEFRHTYIWIQIQLKREFDRLSTDYTPDKLMRTEDIEHTISFVERQAIKCKMGEIPPNKLDKLRVRTGFLVQKTKKLNALLEDLASNSPRKSTNWEAGLQQPESLYSETE